MRRAVLCMLVCAASASAHAASQLPAHLGMYPATNGSASAQSLALVDSHLEVTVRGAIVEVVIRQTFRNDDEHVTEATYIFPLPEDAAVSAMAITSGARTIHADIAKRADAQKRYDDAITAGVGAALLEQERPDVFTQTVSAIPAHGTVEITLRYDTLARPRGDGTWQLALPMVVAPRYVPGTASGRPTTGAGHAPDTDRAPDASRVTPGGQPGAGGSTDVALVFTDPVDDVGSPTHELAPRGHGYALGDAHSDHDMLIRWRAKTPDSGWIEQDDDGGYAAAVISAPPGKARAAKAAAIDLALVLDRSAVVHGDADAGERPLVRELLANLTQADGVIVTGSASLARQGPLDAWRELDRTWTSSPGAFDLTRALQATHGGAIVLVTAGLVADDSAALAAAKALHAPVHVVGVGATPNRALLVAIARDTGGTVRFVAPDDDATAIARDVLADVIAPPAPLAVSWGPLAATDVVPATMPRLGAGQARLVLARVQRAQAANARAQGDVFAIAMVSKEPVVTGELTARGPLARRWARDKLGELLDGAHPDAAVVTAHALHYGLVSPYTSMVAIGDEVVVRGGVKHTVSVPVSVPAGMRWQPVENELHVVTKAEREQTEDPSYKGGKDNAPAPKQPPQTKPPAKSKTLSDRNDDEDASKHGKDSKKGNKESPKKPDDSGVDKWHERDGDDDDDAQPSKTRKKPVSNQPRPTPTPSPVAHHPAPVTPSKAPPAAPPPPPPAAAPSGNADVTGTTGTATGGDDEGEESDGRADGKPSPRKRVAADSAPEPAETESEVAVQGAPTHGVAYRLGLSLGGGLTLTDPRDGLVMIAAQVQSRGWELPTDARIGLEAGLWLVGGAHAQGNFVATLQWRVAQFELGLAAGLHVTGDGAGPAFGLVIRHDVTRHISVYLRYDGTVIFANGTSEGEHAMSAGVQLRW